MSPEQAAAWRALARGQRLAARVSAASRRPVPPQEALERAEALRQLGRGSDRTDPEARERENLLFHLRMRELRRRLSPRATPRWRAPATRGEVHVDWETRLADFDPC